MSSNIQQAITAIDNLSINEKALLAHCLIVGLEQTNDKNVDNKWIEVAEERFSELKSGKNKGVS